MRKDPKSIFFLSSSNINNIKGYRFLDLKYMKFNGGLLLCSIRTL